MIASTAPRHRVFLLSPADSAGKRARLLARDDSDLPLARALRSAAGAELGSVFAFISSLYFRGKLAYAQAFARPPSGLAGVLVITPSDGLVPPTERVRLADLRRYARVPVDAEEARYRQPLERDLAAHAAGWQGAEVVLLGSIASHKYTAALTEALGERLAFPLDFVGRGDMSRGGLLLRCVEEGRELAYRSVLGAARRGSRPARLLPRKAARGRG